jgi:hypothetical protein
MSPVAPSGQARRPSGCAQPGVNAGKLSWPFGPQRSTLNTYGDLSPGSGEHVSGCRRVGVSHQAHRFSYFFLMGRDHPLNRHAHTPIRRSVSPGGPDPNFKRPSGTQIPMDGQPGDKSPGYYRVSLRDEVKTGFQMSKLQGARQSGEQISIGFQPVSSHQPAALFGSRRSGTIVFKPKREPTVVDARYRLEAYATLRRRDFELGTSRRVCRMIFHTR